MPSILYSIKKRFIFYHYFKAKNQNTYKSMQKNSFYQNIKQITTLKKSKKYLLIKL